MPAPTPPYMRFYVEAYCRATLTMTFEEQGVYMRLLCTLWTYGGSIPDDDRLIAKALPIQIQKWQKVKPALLPHLQHEPEGFLSQKTLVDQYQSVTRGKLPNNDSNSPQPQGGPNPGPSQPPNQGPPPRSLPRTAPRSKRRRRKLDTGEPAGISRPCGFSGHASRAYARARVRSI